MPRFVVLLHLYLVVRIVACPCLSGENFHDRLSAAFYGWAGASSRPVEMLADPFGSADVGTCICEGALLPTCPECPPAEPRGGPLAAPIDRALPSPIVPALGHSTRPTIGPSGRDAIALRALLQNFRC